MNLALAVIHNMCTTVYKQYIQFSTICTTCQQLSVKKTHGFYTPQGSKFCQKRAVITVCSIVFWQKAQKKTATS